MNRKVPVRFGGREWRVLFEARPFRLNAEWPSAFLCADLGITPEIRADHANYIKSNTQGYLVRYNMP